MANLRCNVNSCQYNADNLCSLNEIQVGCEDASTSIETICDSYKHKSGSSGSRASKAKAFANIECSAELCTYNKNRKCHADTVHISMSPEDESECSTFKK